VLNAAVARVARAEDRAADLVAIQVRARRLVPPGDLRGVCVPGGHRYAGLVLPEVQGVVPHVVPEARVVAERVVELRHRLLGRKGLGLERLIEPFAGDRVVPEAQREGGRLL